MRLVNSSPDSENPVHVMYGVLPANAGRQLANCSGRGVLRALLLQGVDDPEAGQHLVVPLGLVLQASRGVMALARQNEEGSGGVHDALGECVGQLDRHVRSVEQPVQVLQDEPGGSLGEASARPRAVLLHQGVTRVLLHEFAGLTLGVVDQRRVDGCALDDVLERTAERLASHDGSSRVLRQTLLLAMLFSIITYNTNNVNYLRENNA